MAANTRDIRRRIKSIKNTAQITKAMQMVAASKMRKAQQAALAARPYAELLNKVLVSLQGRTEPTLNDLLEIRPVKTELVLVISTDKGLCGGLNTNLLRELNQFDSAKTLFVPAGRKAAAYMGRTQRTAIAEFELKDNPGLLDTKVISRFLIEKFLSREVDKVSVLFTSFVNTLVQKPTLRTLLPISPFDLPSAPAVDGKDKVDGTDAGRSTEYIFEPSAPEVLSAILPHYLHYEVYEMVLDARASEHSARMVAMKSATDNAKGLIKDLTLEYNKVRQASITNELLEISSAQMAIA